MSIGYIIQAIATEGLIVVLPYIVDIAIVATIAIAAFILSVMSYRNTKKILKKIENREEINK